MGFDPLKVSNNLCDYSKVVGENIGFLIDGIILIEDFLYLYSGKSTMNI